MLSFGYAMLFGNCCASIIGARLNPDFGLMHEGKGSLVQDLIDPLKASMIDRVVFQIARESLNSSDYEHTPNRCILTDELAQRLIGLFHSTIHNEKIDELVHSSQAITDNSEFRVRVLQSTLSFNDGKVIKGHKSNLGCSQITYYCAWTAIYH